MVISTGTYNGRFSRFKSGDCGLEDDTRSGPLEEVNYETPRELVGADPTTRTRVVARRLSCSHITVDRHLGKVAGYGNWIALKVTDAQDSCEWMPVLPSYPESAISNDSEITGDKKNHVLG